MSTPQRGVDVRLDEQGRIVVVSPELARAFVPSDGNIPIDPPGSTGGGIVNDHCSLNLVAGCGRELAQ
ncbi:hypothetical protein [Kitasatospora sp. NPDC056531]|uniref:hypothetical protein n=1 Tax=Kitasatospora sp. NPDC056531 TaxID=3345856 RepID=UPI0036BA6696